MATFQLGDANCIKRIEGLYPAFGGAERLLADYLLVNLHTAINKTIEELGRDSGVSYSTVCRFYKKLGFGSYKEFKARLTEEMISRPRTELEKDLSVFESGSYGNIQQICEQIFELFANVLGDCASLLDANVLNSAVDSIVQAKTLNIIGLGASASSAKYAYTRLLRLGVPCSFEYDPVVFAMKATLMERNDVLLAISSSGRTQTIVQCAKTAQENGATVISISDFSVSPLQQVSDYSLYTTSRNVLKHMDVDLPFTFCQIAIIDIVYSCCINKLGDVGQRRYMQTKYAVDKSRYLGRNR